MSSLEKFGLSGKNVHAKLFPTSVLWLRLSPLPGMPFWLCFAGLTLTHPLKLSSEVTQPRKTVLGLG